ncbi:MAG: hypothetical protein CGW95_15485 [Phenylobacterium zucineum]|nr:MAG: hypothetical protein CGW95_15485 [Phenylobacterium zucineum]
MAQKETPRRSEGLRKDLPVDFLSLPTPATRQAQFLTTAHGVRPILANVLAGLIYGEGVHHG